MAHGARRWVLGPRPPLVPAQALCLASKRSTQTPMRTRSPRAPPVLGRSVFSNRLAARPHFTLDTCYTSHGRQRITPVFGCLRRGLNSTRVARVGLNVSGGDRHRAELFGSRVRSGQLWIWSAHLVPDFVKKPMLEVLVRCGGAWPERFGIVGVGFEPDVRLLSPPPPTHVEAVM